jgi:hypothetical protein
MKLLETYANNVGVKIPQIPVRPFSKYFPKPEKYITLHASSGMGSKNYPHYEQVVNLVKPILDEEGIKILQLGAKEDALISGTRPYIGVTDFHQSTYLVQNAALHVGNDSVWCHVAGQFDVPVVGLYGPTYAEVCGPYYKNPKTILINSHRNGKIPTHTVEEATRTIDMIKPEEVAEAILKVLGFEEKLNFKTLFIGQKYYQKQLQLIPENIQYPTFSEPLIVRMDLIHDEYALARILSTNSAEIKTNKPINPKILEGFRGKIQAVMYEIPSADECDVNFIEHLNRGFRYVMTSKATGEELGKIKLKTFDYGLVSAEKTFEKWENRQYTSNVRAKTKAKLLFGNRLYGSDYHFQKNIPLEGETVRLTEVIESPDFEAFIPHLYIYEII